MFTLTHCPQLRPMPWLNMHTHTHTCAVHAVLPRFLLFLIPYVRVELNRVLDVWVVFLCPKRLTNCCCPEQRQPLHCLSICAQPYQRFNTYCFKLHQSLPPLPSHSPPSLGSFFSVSFYYFASSSFSPLTSLHIILTLVAFSSSSDSLLSSLTPFAPICLISVFPLFSSLLSSLFLLRLLFLILLLPDTLFIFLLVVPLLLSLLEELG